MKKKGTSMVLVDSVGAGDIVSVAGLTKPAIGHTVADVEVCQFFSCIISFLYNFFVQFYLGCWGNHFYQ